MAAIGSTDPDVPAERLREVLRLFTPSEIGPAAARALYELSVGVDPIARLQGLTIYPSDVPTATAALPIRPGDSGSPEPGACGDPACPVLHDDPANPIHPPWYVDSRTVDPDNGGTPPGDVS